MSPGVDGAPHVRKGHSLTLLAKYGVSVTGAVLPGDHGGSDGQEARVGSGRPGTQAGPRQASATLSAQQSGRLLPFGFIWG